MANEVVHISFNAYCALLSFCCFYCVQYLFPFYVRFFLIVLINKMSNQGCIYWKIRPAPPPPRVLNISRCYPGSKILKGGEVFCVTKLKGEEQKEEHMKGKGRMRKEKGKNEIKRVNKGQKGLIKGKRGVRGGNIGYRGRGKTFLSWKGIWFSDWYIDPCARY